MKSSRLLRYVIALTLMTSGCASLQGAAKDIAAPNADGTCSAGWVLMGEGPLAYCLRGAEATPTPTPEPDPTPGPTPTPSPTPEPTPEPTPDPTPEPTPEPTTCPDVSAFACGPNADGTDRHGAVVESAIRAVITARPSYLSDYETRGDGHVRANIRRESDLRAWTVDVAAELRRRGNCAYSGDPNGRSPDEILIHAEAEVDGELVMVAEQWDLAQCGPTYCVGSDRRGQWHDCVLQREPGR